MSTIDGMASHPASSGTRSDPSGVAIMIFAASLFATLGVLSRTAYDQGLTPFAFVAWRAGIGGIGLWVAVLVVRGRRSVLWPAQMSGATRKAMGLAILTGAALNLLMFYAFDHTTVALALLRSGVSGSTRPGRSPSCWRSPAWGPSSSVGSARSP